MQYCARWQSSASLPKWSQVFWQETFFWGGDLIKIVCLSTKYESVPEDLTKLTFTSFSFVCPHFVTLLAITYELRNINQR